MSQRTSATSKLTSRVPHRTQSCKRNWAGAVQSSDCSGCRWCGTVGVGVLATEHWTVPHSVDDGSQDLLHFCKFNSVRARFLLGQPHCYGDALAAFVEENRGDGARAFGHAPKCTVMGTVGVMTQKQYDVTEICRINFFGVLQFYYVCFLLYSWTPRHDNCHYSDYIESSER